MGIASKDVISKDGKRYTQKTAGSPFDSGLGRALSCFLCGKHSDPASGTWRIYFGRRQFICRDHTNK